MKKFKSFLLFVFLCCSVLDIHGETSFQIIPQPQKISESKTKAWHYYELRHLMLTNGAHCPILPPLLAGLDQVPGEGKILELIKTDHRVPEHEEGYVLKVEKSGAKIMAKTDKGLFYGCQSLQQLMEDSRDFNLPIPCLEIQDYPSIDYRAVHLDTKHHLDNMNYYYRMIDKLASYKVNAVIWELEDKLRYTSHPEISVENAISKQEMQALCQYAIERNVEISPLVQGLGHASYILKHHWDLRENPNSDWVFCPMNSKTYEIQFDLYRDALEAMPYGRYLHVGGDEISEIGICDRCKATGKSPLELQMVWLNKVREFAEAQGRQTIFWDDMPLKYGGVWSWHRKEISEKEADELWKKNTLNDVVKLFPKSCIYMRWMYFDPTTAGHRRILNWYKNSGLKVMAATAAAAGTSTFMPRQDSRCHYIKSFNELTAENHLEGILATSWDDGSPHLETVWRGYIGHAEFSWNPKGRSVADYLKAHAQREFGIAADEESTRFLRDLEEAFYFFDGALVVSGRRNPASQASKFNLIELPDVNELGKWSRTYQKKVEQAKKEDARYYKIVKELERIRPMAKRNRYTLEVYTQLNELQHYPVKLILALADCDGNSVEKTTAYHHLQDVCDSFANMKENLEKVYSQTRFLKQPSDFRRESNLHSHIAARTLDFDWMYLYEKAMLKEVYQWLEHNR